MDAIIKIVEGITSGGTTGNIIKGILLLLLIGGSIFLKLRSKKNLREQTQRTNQERRETNQNSTDNETRGTAQDAQDSADRIDDILED